MENNSYINNSKTWRTPPVTISSSIQLDLWKEAQENKITWKEALEFGIRFLIAEKDQTGFYEHPNCKLKDKMNFYRIELEKLNKNIKTPEQEVKEEFEKLGI